jgi:HPt (histidine-containing phosphotransfer) domain-containing protein
METNLIPPIKKAAELLGVPALAEICERSEQAVYKWIKKGRLPRTEWTGETDYATAISVALNGKMTRDQLLQREQAMPNQEEANA